MGLPKLPERSFHPSSNVVTRMMTDRLNNNQGIIKGLLKHRKSQLKKKYKKYENFNGEKRDFGEERSAAMLTWP